MYDFLVIGAGSGGVRFARLMGSKGYKVAIVESDKIGGTCVLRGCIPKKLFIYAANFNRDIELSKDYAWRGKLQDFSLWHFMNKKNNELNRLSSVYNKILENNNVEIIKGEAKFFSPNSIEVANTIYKAKKFLITTGSLSKKIDIPGSDLILDSEAFLNLDTVPKNALILGGGYIALEFANILLALGVKVNIFVKSNILLRKLYSKKLSDFIKEQLTNQGVNFISANSLTKVYKNTNNKLVAEFDTQKTFENDVIINAIGRVPNIDKLNLQAAGININENNAIIVDECFTTSNPNIYALGDVIDKLNLTPVATKQAMYLVEYLTKNTKKDFNYKFVPKTVFSYPQVASCGFTEEEAINEGFDIDIYETIFRPLKLTFSNSKVKSFYQAIVDKKTQKVLGFHIVDTDAGEIMQGFAAALKAGITKSVLNDVIGIHPTSAEELVTMYNKTN